MKFSVSTIALLAATTDAFAPSTFGIRARTHLHAHVIDSAILVEEAFAMSKKYGKNSPEARLAWETVEEVKASDNSEAMKGSLDDECDIDEDYYASSKACMEYNSQLEELEKLLKEIPMESSLLSMAEEVKQVKLPRPVETKPAPPSPELEAAVSTAKRLTDDRGIQSSEARVAWEAVEEISSAHDRDNKARLDVSPGAEELNRFQACAAIEALNRVVKPNGENMFAP